MEQIKYGSGLGEHFNFEGDLTLGEIQNRLAIKC